MITIAEYNQLKESIYNDTTSGKYEGKSFLIFHSTRLIETIESTFTDYFNRVDMRLEYLLDYLSGEYFPFIYNDDDFHALIQSIQTQQAIEFGQLQLGEFDPWHTNIPTSKEYRHALKGYLSECNDLNDLDYDDLNQTILEELCNKLEWGYDDEYETCDNCSKIICTSPDSYSWQPDFIRDDYGIYCKDCIDVNELIESIQTSNKMVLPSCIDIPDDFTRIPHPMDSEHYESSFQNGFHSGMNDSPDKHKKIIQSYTFEGERLLDVIFRIQPSQFYVEWDVYIRVNPNLEECEFTLSPDFLTSLGERLYSSEGRLGYDIATETNKALKHATSNFSTIIYDSEGVKVVSYPDFESWQRGQN